MIDKRGERTSIRLRKFKQLTPMLENVAVPRAEASVVLSGSSYNRIHEAVADVLVANRQRPDGDMEERFHESPALTGYRIY